MITRTWEGEQCRVMRGDGARGPSGISGTGPGISRDEGWSGFSGVRAWGALCSE